MNHILKITLLAMSLVLSVVSAYLTASFMSGLGDNVGLSKPFAAAGIALDVIKTILPAAVLIAWSKGNKNNAIMGAFVAMVLTGLSMMASYSNISESVSAAAAKATNHSQASQLAIKNVARLEKSLDLVLEQQKVFVDAGKATRSLELNPRIDELNEKIELAQNEIKQTSATIKPAIGQDGIAIISAIIELACIAGLVVASSLGVATSTNVDAAMVQATSTTSQTTTTTTLQASGQFESLGKARELIVKGLVKPSERQLATAMQIPRNHAAMLLTALETDGTLMKSTNGRVLASEYVS